MNHPRDIREFYELLDAIERRLDEAGESHWADRLRDAVLGGATSGEILERVGVVLGHLSATAVPVSSGVASDLLVADEFIAGRLHAPVRPRHSRRFDVVKELRRFWFAFEKPKQGPLPPGTGWGVGVTAIDRDDAIALMRERVFRSGVLPTIRLAIEDVDVSTLDEGHVLPNMGDVLRRGIWFPLGYE